MKIESVIWLSIVFFLFLSRQVFASHYEEITDLCITVKGYIDEKKESCLEAAFQEGLKTYCLSRSDKYEQLGFPAPQWNQDPLPCFVTLEKATCKRNGQEINLLAGENNDLWPIPDKWPYDFLIHEDNSPVFFKINNHWCQATVIHPWGTKEASHKNVISHDATFSKGEVSVRYYNTNRRNNNKNNTGNPRITKWVAGIILTYIFFRYYLFR